MIIAFACDHGGFIFRESIFKHLSELWHTILDVWPQSVDALDDFPHYALRVAQSLQDKTAERWILVCGTGIGMSIAANRFRWVNAAVLYSPEIAKIAREHNNINIACFGARTMQIDVVSQSLNIFLTEPFLGWKYQKREQMIDDNSCGTCN